MHPFNAHRDHKVQHSRVGHITKGYASGGAVMHGVTGGPISAKAVSQRDAQAVEGKLPAQRLDRPTRAKGGRVKGHKGTHVNVIVAPQAGQHPPPALPVGAGAGAPPVLPAPRPPMPPPGAMAGPPGVGGPPGMPMPPPGIRRSGGRTYASGGAVSGPAWKEGNRAGTQVQHADGKMDQPNIGRPKVVTYKKGGRVKRDDGGAVSSQDAQKMMRRQQGSLEGGDGSDKYQQNLNQGRKTGGRIYAPEGAGATTPHLPGGAGGGLARLRKAHTKHGKMRI